MSVEFEYLRKFVGYNNLKGNYFLSLKINEIKEAETILNYFFPSELRKFYLDIGTGILSGGKDYLSIDSTSILNEILPPLVVAHFYQGILEHQLEPKEEALEHDDHWMALSTLEMLEPGDLPFFEIGDSSSFMTMKLRSDNPNAVWSDCGVKIEDSFERFIWRLYYENPGYYGDIIESHYAQKN